jgi:RNA polymerase sigma-70 factor (ECF subfamily)
VTAQSLQPEAERIARLKARDDAVFAELVDAWSPTLLGLTRAVLRDDAAAEEVTQEAWIALIEGIDTFDGRSSLKTWLCQVALNRARTRAQRELRQAPAANDREEALFDAGGDWLNPVRPWQQPPDALLERAQLGALLAEALAGLPEVQRLVVTLRDVEGMSPGEVCHILGVSETNQRQLLHRGRAKVRAALAAREEKLP